MLIILQLTATLQTCCLLDCAAAVAAAAAACCCVHFAIGWLAM